MLKFDGPFPRWLPFLLVSLLLLSLHTAIASAPTSPLKRERYFGPDSYSRILRVQELQRSGAWYMAVYPRSNAPLGEPQHSTRPFDLILFSGAWILTPFLGFDGGLYWWSMIVSPFLYLLAGALLA